MGSVWLEYVWYNFEEKRKTFVCSHLVLHRHFCYGSGIAYHQLDGIANQFYQKLLSVCRRSGCTGSMVVWTQRRSVLFNYSLLGVDVLLYAQGSQSASIFLPTFNYPFLVFDIFRHLGWPPSLVVYRIAKLGSITWGGVFRDANFSKLGWYDQRLAHFKRSMG